MILKRCGEILQANLKFEKALANSSIIAHVEQLLRRYAASKNLTVQNVLHETKEGGELEFLRSLQLEKLDTVRQFNLAKTRCAWIKLEDSKMFHFMKEFGKCYSPSFH